MSDQFFRNQNICKHVLRGSIDSYRCLHIIVKAVAMVDVHRMTYRIRKVGTPRARDRVAIPALLRHAAAPLSAALSSAAAAASPQPGLQPEASAQSFEKHAQSIHSLCRI